MGSKTNSESDNISSVEGMKIPSIELPDELFEKSLDPWRFSLIGRGFFTMKLDNSTDRNYIKSQVWEVTDQILKVRNWVYNFRPTSQRTSKDFVWVRFPGLGLEFWSESILSKICKEIGTPIKIDEATTKCDVGYYANVLVEVDFSSSVPNKVWIGTKYGVFFQEVSITDCPKYCNSCKMVGHFITECRVEKAKRNETNSENIITPQQPKNDNEDSVIHTIHVTPTVPVHQIIHNATTGRFSPLECVQQNILEDIMVNEDKTADVVETPQIKFVDGKTGTFSDETVKVTSW
ncbi:uncharacterized protein LOC113352257 [Papaver somniferum]|uniref:uncharacterized protein LOC113352257 n=1 Tax=Papaver somniferum TaxID=3469 RepID=UPI000E7028F2|nr:uncharacterized protein LOC113352257 [Papaver somniferum]